jgi:hypothetical protein
VVIMKKENVLITVVPVIALAISTLACNFPALQASTGEAAGPDELEALVAEMVAEEMIAAQAGLAAGVEGPPAGEQEQIAPEEAPQPVEATAGGSAESVPAESAPPEPAPEPVEACSDRASFIADVSIPDNTEIEAGDGFTKTWRLRNIGTCTWSSSYALVFSHGDQMGGAASVPLAGIVNPGETVDLSVDLAAPGSHGTYQGFWKLRNQDSVLFGVGADSNMAFWVKIIVPDEEESDGGDGMLAVVPELFAEPLFLHLALFTSSGTGQHLPDGACFDLDGGTGVSCGLGNADFKYEADFEMDGFILREVYEVRPLHGARFGGQLSSQPTGADCQAASLGGGEVEVDHGYHCYQTSAGKYGYLRVAGTSLMVLEFDWGTYTLP